MQVYSKYAYSEHVCLQKNEEKGIQSCLSSNSSNIQREETEMWVPHSRKDFIIILYTNNIICLFVYLYIQSGSSKRLLSPSKDTDMSLKLRFPR